MIAQQTEDIRNFKVHSLILEKDIAGQRSFEFRLVAAQWDSIAYKLRDCRLLYMRRCNTCDDNPEPHRHYLTALREQSSVWLTDEGWVRVTDPYQDTEE